MAVPHPAGGGQLAGSIAAGAVGILFGSAFLGTAFVLRAFDPLSAVFWRAGLATLMLLPVVALGADRSAPPSDVRWPPRGRLVRALALALAILGGPAFLTSMNLAVATSGVAISGFVVGQYAIFAALLAQPLLGERVRRRALIGLVAAVVGTALLADRPGYGIELVGVLIGMIGAIAYALYIVMGRRWSRRYQLRPEVIVLTSVALSTAASGCTS